MSGKIVTRCVKCRAESEVRGVDWNELFAAIPKLSKIVSLTDVPVVERVCAPCRFRANQATREKTPEQKEVRRQYNQSRNLETKLARKLFQDVQEGRVTITGTDD